MFVVLVFAALWVAYLPPALKDPVPLDGLATVAIIGVSLLVIARGRGAGYRQWLHWIPWALVLSVGLIRNPEPAAAYRCILYLGPVLVGWASFLLSRSQESTDAQLLMLSKVSVFVLTFGTAWTMWISGTHTPWSFERAGGAPATVAIIMILGVLAPTAKARMGWLLAALVNPVIGLNRMALLVAALVPVLVLFAKRASGTKVILGGLAGTALLALMLEIPMIKEEMFYSGDGSIATFIEDPTDIRTHGRARFWAAVYLGMQGQDWVIGHGADTSAAVVAEAHKGQTHPHNDWLRIVYDYGVIGILAYVFGLVREFQTLRPTEMGPYAIIARAGLCALSLMMVTGNVALYGVFFGNIVFMLGGFARRNGLRRQALASATVKSLRLGLASASGGSSGASRRM